MFMNRTTRLKRPGTNVQKKPAQTIKATNGIKLNKLNNGKNYYDKNFMEQVMQKNNWKTSTINSLETF